MYYDWVKGFQDFGFELPVVADRAYQNIHIQTGEVSSIQQPRFSHQGSYSTAITIKISGSTVYIEGNPSKYNRLDNVVGLSSLDACMSVFNNIMDQLGLPRFTKCTKTYYRQGQDGEAAKKVSDGFTFQRIDINSNVCTGGNSKAYLSAISSQRYKNSIPKLYENGYTVDWKSPKGNVGLEYRKAYDKANELKLHTLGKIARKYGKESEEYLYLQKLISFLDEKGVVRFEQGLHSRLLSRIGCKYWGLFDEALLRSRHQDFLSIQDKVGCVKMELQDIADKLLSEDIVKSRASANATALYAIQWMHGKQFDFGLRAVQKHRARLRQIGIDIKNACDLSTFSPIIVKKTMEINVTPLVMPAWYRRADYTSQLMLAG